MNDLHDDDEVVTHVDERKKPRLSHLEDAIELVNDLPRFKVGLNDKIIIERNVEVNGKPQWLDTRTYLVKKIDHDTGAVRLWDTVDKRFAGTNYIDVFANPLYSVKIVEIEKRKVKDDSVPLRTVYNDGERTFTRYKNSAYYAPARTLARKGSKVSVVAQRNGTLSVSDAKMGWNETWAKE